MRTAQTILALLALASPAAAQRQHAPAPPPPKPGGEPQRTTATFDDWTLRCVHPDGTAQACEVTQTIFDKDRPVAQTALGRPAGGEPMRLTILVPVNVQLTTAPHFELPDGKTAFDLAWRRCIPAGCLADAPLTDALLQGLRTRTDNARIIFKDAAGHDGVLPFTAKGLPQALDALAKAEAG